MKWIFRIMLILLTLVGYPVVMYIILPGAEWVFLGVGVVLLWLTYDMYSSMHLKLINKVDKIIKTFSLYFGVILIVISLININTVPYVY